MLRQSYILNIALLVLLLLVPSGTPARANALVAECYRVAADVPPQTHCDFRAAEPTEFDKFEVRLGDGRNVSPVAYDPYNFKGRSTAYLFLIQRTSHPRDAVTQIERLLKVEGKRQFGVYTFDERVKELAKLGSSEKELKSALEQVKLLKTGTTALYSSLREAILTLGDFKADRKAIVLVADGRTDSGRDAYGEKEVLEEAQKHNIVIDTIAMTTSGDASANLQTLRRLADKTYGLLIDTGSAHVVPDDKVSKFYDYLENGGLLKMPDKEVPSGAELTVSANLTGAGTWLTSEKVPVKSGPGASGSEGPIWVKAKDWASKNLIAVGAFGVLLAGVLVIGLTVMRRGRLPEPVQGAPGATDEEFVRTAQYGRGGDPTAIMSASDTVILAPMNERKPPEKIYAWLQFLDANSTRVPIGATNVRIGRHSDNDICLQNNSVHRQHAVLHMGHNQHFVIRDLGTKNGVMVNSERVNQKELSDGDLIELGEVRLRFFSNPEAAH
jgi:hypothetical protein